MGPGDAFLRAPALIATASGSGGGYGVAITDAAGTPLAACDAEGTVRDAGEQVFLHAPIHSPGRRERATAASIEVTDAAGAALGTAKVLKYRIGPRARKATVAIADPAGSEVARLEATDKKGERLTVHAGDAELATVAVEKVKAGFMRKDSVYAVNVTERMPEEQRALLVAVLVRYDALLKEVADASARED